MSVNTLAVSSPQSGPAEMRRAYAASAPAGDVLLESGDDPAWNAVLEELHRAGDGDLAPVQDQLQRRVDEMGTSFRLSGEAEERQWPLSPVPLLIDEQEWAGIADAVAQRADLAERIVADIYGQQRLVTSGVLPASVLTGSSHYLHPMVGIKPVGGHYLHVYACDIGRGPDGEWRVLADHTRSPAGAGYALENRLAASQVLGGIARRLNVARLAPFFTDLRAGIAAACKRSDPRIALLSPGRFNQSYAEQAHLARYLGLLLVEGADVAVHDDRIYLRTIEGLKRVDALWQRMDARMLDPLALDPRSAIGVPGLLDAMAAGGTVVANFPGAAVLESPLFAAFMPPLARRLLGEPLKLPNIATWWCGQPAEAAHVIESLDNKVIAAAFGVLPAGLDRNDQLGSQLDDTARARLIDDIALRPQDYIGQEVVRLSTMPVVEGGALVARPFMVRVFAARDESGQWSVMSGGFARIGAIADFRAAAMGIGTRSADVVIHRSSPVAPVTLLKNGGGSEIRRNPGTLPSRVADNLYWLGRYLERGETVLALVRAGAGGSLVTSAGSSVPPAVAARIRTRLYADLAFNLPQDAPFGEMLVASLDDLGAPASVAALLASARSIGAGSRERLSPDFWQILDARFPGPGLFQQKNVELKARFAALAGLASEHMGRTAGWRFHDLGRRIERAIALCRLVGAFGDDHASADDLTTLLELCDVQITYRQRYSTGLALLPVRDLVGLDPFNPRSIAFQVLAIRDHLAALPRLSDDGMDEPQQSTAIALAARIATLDAATLNGWACTELEQKLMSLSDLVANRFFLRGSEALRAAGLTLA
jgi:uncharacterized circularly permuted ATP-grasp superfamily protein/uncharacterized alpha-E superfamily protein